MVAAKSLLATAFLTAALLALCTTGAALADNPTVRISSADEAKAVAALLRQSDLGAGWAGGQTRASSLAQPYCPGFAPTESDLVVTGHADARFTFAPGGVVIDQDVEVLASPSAVIEDFARTITSKFPPCLAYQLLHSPNVLSASVAPVPFPRTGVVSAAYRATLLVRYDTVTDRVLSDYVYFGEGRLEYSFNIIAPLTARDQLERFEVVLAELLLRRQG